MWYLERQRFGSKYILEPSKNTISIGRSICNDIIFPSTFVSRKHCEIRRVPPFGTLLIRNCTTNNTTHVNGTKLSNDDVAELRIGSMIGLGVPLDLASGDRLEDERFVFLKVCEENKDTLHHLETRILKENQETYNNDHYKNENEKKNIVNEDQDVVLSNSNAYFVDQNLDCKEFPEFVNPVSKSKSSSLSSPPSEMKGNLNNEVEEILYSSINCNVDSNLHSNTSDNDNKLKSSSKDKLYSNNLENQHLEVLSYELPFTEAEMQSSQNKKVEYEEFKLENSSQLVSAFKSHVKYEQVNEKNLLHSFKTPIVKSENSHSSSYNSAKSCSNDNYENGIIIIDDSPQGISGENMENCSFPEKQEFESFVCKKRKNPNNFCQSKRFKVYLGNRNEKLTSKSIKKFSSKVVDNSNFVENEKISDLIYSNELVSIKQCSIQICKLPELENASGKNENKFLNQFTLPNENLESNIKNPLRETSDSTFQGELKSNTEGLNSSMERLTIKDKFPHLSNDIEMVNNNNNNFILDAENKLDSDIFDESDGEEINYSQVNEPILISSDDESVHMSSTVNVNKTLNSCIFKKEYDFPCVVKVEKIDDDDEEDFDLPDLFSYQENTKNENGSLVDNFNNYNSPSRERRVDDPEVDWWPKLSQEFFNDDLKHNENVLRNNNNNKDLNTVLKKVKSRNYKKLLLTEPKEPLKRTKSDTIRKKRGRRCSSSIESSKIESSKTEELSEEIKEKTFKNTDSSNQSSTSFSLSSHRKSRNKSGDIRKKLQKTHDLGMYKSRSEKKHHHLVDKSNECSNYSKVECKKYNTVKTFYEDNISVLPKNKNKLQNSPKKGIAKISTRSRSEKLTEIDLFSITGELQQKNKSGFKIPKIVKPKSDKVTNNTPKSSTSAFDVDKERENIELQKLLHSEKGKELSLNVISLSKSIVKPFYKTNKEKRVHFPIKMCELVTVKTIPRGESKDFTGPENVNIREKYLKHEISEKILVNPLKFIFDVCNWNYDWLTTYKVMRDKSKRPQLPNIIENVVLPKFTLYNSLNDYQQVFSAMLYYETWEAVYKEWEQNFKTSGLLCEIDFQESKYISETQTNYKYFRVKAISFVSREKSKNCMHPIKGTLISMRHKSQENKVRYTLGYVNDVQKRNCSYISQNLKERVQGSADTTIILEIFLSKKYVEAELMVGTLVSIHYVAYIRPNYKAFECLINLGKSPLHNAILNPSNTSYFRLDGSKSDYMIKKVMLNSKQQEAVIDISSKCIFNLNTPKLSLIHGPPGTGKTRVIAALVTQINSLFKEAYPSQRRILLCAPSNTAVDELVLRISSLKKIGINLNIVRAGINKSMRSEVESFSLDSRVNKELEKTLIPKNKNVEKELKDKKKFCLDAFKEYEKAKTESKSKETIDQLHHRWMKLKQALEGFERSCKMHLSKYENSQRVSECRRKVLMKAEIIATTLISSASFFDVFNGDKSAFACCIIDEAGQCKESEIWFPLQFGIKKLILVGDHCQLPATVLSHLTQARNLHQSLFKRLYHHIAIEKSMPDIIHTLNVQYRMHEDIFSWPARHFYNNGLITPSEISRERKYALHPYLIFNIKNSSEEQKKIGEIYNSREIEVIQALIESHKTYLSGLTIGIITPYQKQKQLLQERLSALIDELDITISTVDNFQGQERDVIYCSFVRSNSMGKIGFVSDPQRLNVALTRARKSCFIIGDLLSLKTNTDWKSLIEDAHIRNCICDITYMVNPQNEKHKLLQLSLAASYETTVL